MTSSLESRVLGVSTRRAAGVLGTAIMLVGLGCAREPERTNSPRDVLLVTIDTARADRFSYAERSPVATAATDSVAQAGAAFLTAVAPSPITLVSHASLFTGQDPFVHGVRNNGDFALGPGAVTLAEVLSERGWTTAAFVGTAVLDRKYGLDQGFGKYDDEIAGSGGTDLLAHARRPGNVVVDAALRWLQKHPSEQTFMWVHLYDPHAPYRPPEPERSLYPDSPYNGALAFADRMVGVLLDGFSRQRNLEDSLVIVTSDHGESLDDHQERTHGVFVYDATVRIPLVMRGPGIAPGTRVSAPVALIDIMPTVLRALAIEVPPSVHGTDLAPLLENVESENDRAIYIESLLPQLSFGWSPLRGLRTERWKYIEGAARELYDLDADPGELEDLAGQQASLLDRMSQRLAGMTEDGGLASTAVSLEVDEEERARLAALGYVSSAEHGAGPADESELPDPRERIVILNRMHSALTRFSEGEEREAIADLEGLLVDEPRNHSVIATLGSLQYRAGEFSAAADSYARAADLEPDHAHYRELEALALERLGRYGEALEACERALDSEPGRVSARDARWRLLIRMGRDGVVAAELEQEAARNPGDGQVAALLLEVQHGFEPSPELVRELEHALAADPGDVALTAALARAVAGLGDEARSVILYREVLEERPGDLAATLVVGGRALAEGRHEEARTLVEAGVRQNPDDAAMQVLAARARMAEGDFTAARDALVRAYKLRPGWAHTWLAAAELGIREGLPDQAAANLDRAVAAAGDDPDLRRRIADAYRRLGREDDARRAEAR